MLLLLDPYVDAILALALAYLSLKIVQALFGPLDGLPVIGGALAKLDHAISQSVANACGAIVHPIDVVVGGSFSKIASLIRRVGGVIRSHAQVLAEASSLIAALALAYHAVRSLSHDLHSRFSGIDTRIRSVEKEFHGIEHRVKSLEHDLTKGIGHDLRLSLQADEKALHHLERKVIPSIRGDVATAEGEIGNLFDWIRGKADIIGAGTFAGAVAAVLSLAGLDWIACKSRSSVNGKSGCALWNDLEGLLQVAAIPLEIASLVELIKVAQQVTPDIVNGVENLLDV